MDKPKRLTLFAGHYGSGKTNIALNYALWLRGQGLPVVMADLDIVNPYFRMKDSEDLLAKAGIHLISSAYANSNVDLPAMPKETYSLVADRGIYGVLDIGGDDRGALALGRYVPEILEENNYEMFLVANKARPLTRTVSDTLGVLQEIEEACSLPFTAIAGNTNFGPQTAAEDVCESLDYLSLLSERSGLPVKMVCARREICTELAGKWPAGAAGYPFTKDILFPLELQKLYYSEDCQTIPAACNTEVSHAKTNL